MSYYLNLDHLEILNSSLWAAKSRKIVAPRFYYLELTTVDVRLISIGSYRKQKRKWNVLAAGKLSELF